MHLRNYDVYCSDHNKLDNNPVTSVTRKEFRGCAFQCSVWAPLFPIMLLHSRITHMEFSSGQIYSLFVVHVLLGKTVFATMKIVIFPFIHMSCFLHLNRFYSSSPGSPISSIASHILSHTCFFVWHTFCRLFSRLLACLGVILLSKHKHVRSSTPTFFHLWHLLFVFLNFRRCRLVLLLISLQMFIAVFEWQSTNAYPAPCLFLRV